MLVPETSPAVITGAGERVRTRLFHPAAVFPGVLVGCGAFGMAGFLAFVPLYARQVGLDGAALPLAVYALIVVGLRLAFAKLPDQVGAAKLSGGALVVAAIGLLLTVAFASPIGLVVGTGVYAAGVAFLFPALLSLAVSRVAETERGVAVGTTSVFLDASFGGRARGVRRDRSPRPPSRRHLSAIRFNAVKPLHSWRGASRATAAIRISRGSKSWMPRPGSFPSRNTIASVPAGARASSNRRLSAAALRPSLNSRRMRIPSSQTEVRGPW